MSTQPKAIPSGLNFVFGGAAGMVASAVVHPLVIIKTRMQLAGQQGEKITSKDVFSGILKNDGVRGMYKGLTATLFRQCTYTTARLGVFNWLLESTKSSEGIPIGFGGKLGLGIFAGMCAAFVGTSAELCMIRMTGDGRLPPAERRNYTHVGNALVRIVREEGVLTLWRGCGVTVIRSCVVNGTQLSTYSQIKQMVLTNPIFDEGLLTHFIAAMTAGFTTTCTSLPIDILKTRKNYHPV